MLCEFGFKMPIHAPFGVFRVKLGETGEAESILSVYCVNISCER